VNKLLIIPSIELEHGVCERCIVGEPGTERLYAEISGHPVELAQLWRRENAKTIHVVDVDSFKGHDDNATVQAVVLMQRAVDVPIEFVTRQTNIDIYRRLLEQGVYRVAVNIVTITDPEGVEDLVEEFSPSRVVLGVRAHNGDVDCGSVGGMVSDEEFIRNAHDLGIRRMIYSETDWEGRLSGQDVRTLQRIATVSTMRVTTAGGVASPEQLWELQQFAPRQVDSVVIGRALYENRFPCQVLWRKVEALLEPEIHQHAVETDVQSSISQLRYDSPKA
jgi:phosphoribosylformimino-5-aminoimidazole carboxamide ribotide isomerase